MPVRPLAQYCGDDGVDVRKAYIAAWDVFKANLGKALGSGFLGSFMNVMTSGILVWPVYAGYYNFWAVAVRKEAAMRDWYGIFLNFEVVFLLYAMVILLFTMIQFFFAVVSFGVLTVILDAAVFYVIPLVAIEGMDFTQALDMSVKMVRHFGIGKHILASLSLLMLNFAIPFIIVTIIFSILSHWFSSLKNVTSMDEVFLQGFNWIMYFYTMYPTLLAGQIILFPVSTFCCGVRSIMYVQIINHQDFNSLVPVHLVAQDVETTDNSLLQVLREYKRDRERGHQDKDDVEPQDFLDSDMPERSGGDVGANGDDEYLGSYQNS